jgi:hypothetical protein
MGPASLSGLALRLHICLLVQLRRRHYLRQRREDIMADKQDSTAGVFTNLEQAERSVEDLQSAGFPREQISVVGNVRPDDPAFPASSAVNAPEENAIEGVVVGGLVGAVVGAVVLLAIPGLGEVTGTGYWFELLGGLLLGAAVGGCLFAFAGLFLSSRRARYLNSQMQQGRYVVSVRGEQRQAEAADVLRRGGSQVDSVARE